MKSQFVGPRTAERFVLSSLLVDFTYINFISTLVLGMYSTYMYLAKFVRVCIGRAHVTAAL